jgi:hypothetical protein
MVAVLAEASVQADPVEEWLVEQLTYLADEYFHRVLRPQQRIWVRAACPWCRRMAEANLSHVRCPVCRQIKRSRNQPEYEDDD